MSKRKTAASSGRLAGGFGGFGTGTQTSSSLSYIQEPLDYSQLSEPTLGVIFKNLSKKDETTKAKALDDLATYFKSSETAEAGVAELWIRLFPRLSIDNSRRVRQLAQVVNGRLCLKLGKRTAKYMPQLVGPWLAAQFDNDKTVNKAAKDALLSIFHDAGKLAAIWSIYTHAILDYCKSAILTESASTLNDERTISPDDAQLVYVRTMASCVQLVASLLQHLETSKFDALSDEFTALLDEKVFGFIILSDAALRRAVHHFVRTAVSKLQRSLKERQRLISNYYVYKGLVSDQQASRIDYLDTLIELSSTYPDIWQQYYSGKKSALSRLVQFFESGSQGATALYWTKCVQLLEILPPGIVGTSSESSADLLRAFRTGLNRREERPHNVEAWRAYIRLVDVLTAGLSEQDKSHLYDDTVSPLIVHFADPAAENWAVTGTNGAAIFATAELDERLARSIESATTTSIDKLIESIRMSQPEQSQRFQESQTQLSRQGDRQAELLRSLLSNTSLSAQARDHIVNESTRLVRTALEIIVDRKGKTFGAASLISAVVRALSTDSAPSAALQEAIDSFSRGNLSSILLSPSGSALVSILHQIKQPTDFDALFLQLITDLLRSEQSDHDKLTTVVRLIDKDTSADALRSLEHSDELQHIITRVDPQKSQALLIQVLTSGLASKETALKCITSLEQSLNSVSEAKSTLESLNAIALKDHDLLINNVQLVARVLDLRESPDDEIADLAALLSTKLSTVDRGQTGTRGADIVRRAIGNNALPVEAVLELADTYLGNHIPLETVQDMLPKDYDWRSDLRQHGSPPRPILSICSPLRGAVHFVVAPQARANIFAAKATRYVLCISQLLTKLAISDESITSLHDILHFVTTTLAMIDDQLSVTTEKIALSFNVNPETVTSSTSAIATLIQSLSPAQYRQLLSSVSPNRADDNFTIAYYSSLAKFRWLSARSDQSDHLKAAFPGVESFSESITTINVFDMTAMLACEQPSSFTEAQIKSSNQLASNLTSSDLGATDHSVLRRSLTLTMLLSTGDTLLAGIAKQRVMFLIKHLLSSAPNSPAVTESVLDLLSLTLPAVADMYGSHWSNTLSMITGLWTAQSTGEGLPSLFASLKLYNKLVLLSQGESANEDLVEALQEKAVPISESLVSLLVFAGGVSEDGNRPSDLFCRLLSRTLTSVKTVPTVEAEELYPLLHAPSSSVQHAAFDLLQRQVQSSVEQISVEAALDKMTVRLPNALLSSILEVPAIDEVLDEEASPRLQTYLYSWRLIFEHMRGASYKVQSDYGEQIKEGGFLGDLLTLTVAGLRLVRGKAADTSAHSLTDYDDAAEPDPLKNRQWLLTHLYFLSLRHLAGQVKTWMLEQKARQLPTTVQSWTAKYVSPLLIADSLEEVSKWSQTTVNEDPEYEKMQVIVGTKSKEINVKYVVDEQTMAIKVVLPEAYPLVPAQVIGINRVAVKEEKWQSWLRNCQGVITFSNGSISDGLNAWRRNVTGALKGQTECAICYSIISADRQLPSKRCPTCKNLFHSSCLFKWFKTSNASTCPLCRNPFNFNG